MTAKVSLIGAVSYGQLSLRSTGNQMQWGIIIILEITAKGLHIGAKPCIL